MKKLAVEKERMQLIGVKLREGCVSYFVGFREACCLHRALIMCLRSRQVLIRTLQCFLLNGFLFLGSILLLNSVVTPTLQWILPDQCHQIGYQEHCDLRFNVSLRNGLLQVFDMFWFYPMYIFSYILGLIWSNDIAKYAFAVMKSYESGITESSGQHGASTSQTTHRSDRPAGLESFTIGLAEQLYSVVLMTIFFFEVSFTGYIPNIGKILNFFLLSWLYAYYCFEYKWNLSEVALDRRLVFFESNWVFFAGFGSPCVLPIFFFSNSISYGMMAILYPLFVLTATCSAAAQNIHSHEKEWSGAALGRLPIFYIADTISLRVLRLISLFSSKTPGKVARE